MKISTHPAAFCMYVHMYITDQTRQPTADIRRST
jgi:hypothetical protein